MPTLVLENVEFTLKVASWSRPISVFCYNVANNAMVSVPFCYLQIMANDAPICIICKERGEKKRALKCFNSSNWETAKNAARRRKAIQSDKFSNTSEEIRTAEGPEGKYYHSVCLSRFCAVKRGAPPSTEPSEPPQKTTRSSSDHPSTSTRGVLGQECLFCGQKRKRKLQKNEPLSQCLTTDGSKAILLAAKKKCDTRIIGLGEDLIAKEAKYHNTCRRDYVRLDVTDEEQTSNRKMHVEAFKNLSMFLENEVIKNKTPMLASVIFNLYKEEFLALGGTQDDIDRYTTQSLISKIKERFLEILVDKRTNKSGNLVFHSSLTSAEAFALLTDSNEKIEEIRCAAMALRTEILAIPQSKTPSPTSVHTLKENSPSIPDLTLVFFRTLIGGLQSEIGVNNSNRDVMERKALAGASDAVFNCTRGRVRPWKHQALGLGLGTLTGSKTVLTTLNRFGHCISYDEVKRLETEMAYTCSDLEQETPAGLHLRDGLGTGNNNSNNNSNNNTNTRLW